MGGVPVTYITPTVVCLCSDRTKSNAAVSSKAVAYFYLNCMIAVLGI